MLRGAKTMLANQKIDYIQFESGGCNIDSKTYSRDFFDLLSPGFTIYPIVGNGLQPIQVYKETHEIFTTVNDLAERK